MSIIVLNRWIFPEINEEIALLLNEYFISIKVDREERPDLDAIYMDAVQILTGSGGWPLSVFLTPSLKPFYGGTYFPPSGRIGIPGFKTLIATIARTWKENQEAIKTDAAKLTSVIENYAEKEVASQEKIEREVLSNAAINLLAAFDPLHGGFGTAPKFPQSMALEYLMLHYYRTKDERVLAVLATTLDNMASGGMYDHLGGGFHRYSTDREWLVPHFEKMLYDNALLSDLYLNAFQLTKQPFYKKIAMETIEYVLREMTDTSGGFHSTQDADSEGEEGKFYVWTYSEIIDALGRKDGRYFCDYYSVREKGNFKSPEEYHGNQNILHINSSNNEFEYDEKRINVLRQQLLRVRNKRVPPGKDDKIITAWNGLMISSLVHGYQILGNSKYLEAAERAANFILTDLYADRRLLRIYRHGKAKQPHLYVGILSANHRLPNLKGLKSYSPKTAPL